MKRFLLFTAALCLSLIVYAQDEPKPVILLSSQGKIVYQSPAKRGKQTVATGAVFKRAGEIQLKKNSSALLYCEGKFKTIQGNAAVALTEVFPVGNSMVKMNFDLTFGDYVMAAFIMAANAKTTDGWGGIKDPDETADGWGGIKDPDETADGWGGIKDPDETADGWGTIKDPDETADGWGGMGHRISAIQPFGKITAGKTTFNWSKPAGNPAYHLSVIDANGKIITETTTSDTFLSLDLDKLGLAAGSQYQWVITTEGSNPMKSNVLRFEIGSADMQNGVLRNVEKSELYQQSPEVVRGLMRATALEKLGWFDAAANTLRETQAANPDNEVVKLMHAAFWNRWGLRVKARAVYK